MTNFKYVVIDCFCLVMEGARFDSKWVQKEVLFCFLKGKNMSKLNESSRKSVAMKFVIMVIESISD